MRRALPVFLVSLSGCLSLPPPRADASGPDGGAPPERAPIRVLSLAAFDRNGAEWPLEGIPTRPRLRLTLSEPPWREPDEPLPVWLFAGEADDALAADLADDPLRIATQERAVPVELSTEGAVVELSPTDRLARGAALALGVGAWLRAGSSGLRLGEPFVAALRASADPEAGARATDSWPPDGAASVPPSIPELVVRFDGPVRGVREGLVLLEEDGGEVPAAARPAACEEHGWADGECAVLAPARPLAPSAMHRLVVREAVLDATGAPVGPWSARFTTAPDDDGEPPALLPLPCALDEVAIDAGCVLADDARVTLRVQASEPVRLVLSIAGRTLLSVAPRGSAALGAGGLPPDTALAAILRAEDLGGNVVEFPLALRTTEPLATLSIVEVRADPLGAEPRQEYVEILNYGSAPLDLEGVSIADRPDSMGDVLARGHRLAPGQRALLVADGFDPEDPADVPVPPGVPLVRIGASLATGGLTNAGEALFLRDAALRRLSASPALSAGPGACIVRVGADPRRGAPEDFSTGPCTPGLPP